MTSTCQIILLKFQKDSYTVIQYTATSIYKSSIGSSLMAALKIDRNILSVECDALCTKFSDKGMADLTIYSYIKKSDNNRMTFSTTMLLWQLTT